MHALRGYRDDETTLLRATESYSGVMGCSSTPPNIIFNFSILSDSHKNEWIQSIHFAYNIQRPIVSKRILRTIATESMISCLRLGWCYSSL